MAIEKDPLVQMAIEEHSVRMRVLQLTEWKLYNDCVKNGYGLPPSYDSPLTRNSLLSSHSEGGFVRQIFSADDMCQDEEHIIANTCN